MSGRNPSARMFSTALAAFIAFTFVAGADAREAAVDGVNLRPRPRAGQLTRYEVWSLRDQSSQVSFNGRDQTIATRFEVKGVVTWKVDRVGSDGSSTCSLNTEWLAITLTGPDGGVQNADSRKAAGDNEQMQRLLKAMAGVVVKIEVAPDGSIRSASGVDAIRKRAGQGVNVPDENDFIESASDTATIPFAPVSAADGASWDAAYSWNHEMGRLLHSTKYTLVGVEKIAGIPVATVNAAGKLRLETDPSKLPQGPGAPRVDVKLLSGTWTSQILFDLLRHEAVGRNTTQTTRIEVKARVENQTITRVVDETIQSQALRIEEE